jgi:hypothetical protein
MTSNPSDLLESLTPAMCDALANMAGRRQATNIAWGQASDVHKSSLYALERRGLAVHNRYRGRAKLTPLGIRMAAQLAAEEGE